MSDVENDTEGNRGDYSASKAKFASKDIREKFRNEIIRTETTVVPVTTIVTIEAFVNGECFL